MQHLLHIKHSGGFELQVINIMCYHLNKKLINTFYLDKYSRTDRECNKCAIEKFKDSSDPLSTSPFFVEKVLKTGIYSTNLNEKFKTTLIRC